MHYAAMMALMIACWTQPWLYGCVLFLLVVNSCGTGTSTSDIIERERQQASDVIRPVACRSFGLFWPAVHTAVLCG